MTKYGHLYINITLTGKSSTITSLSRIVFSHVWGGYFDYKASIQGNTTHLSHFQLNYEFDYKFGSFHELASHDILQERIMAAFSFESD